ncbi:E3 ubiquitin-protein ligase UBR2 [Nakaseomyces bracarensis]|uniref:E3 ubiquitin-protein ligase n=1 Tax=Nakaseomyces bracarensis TaxID=273131 RepID=A0ABR4NQH4_9SACH
MGSEQVAINDLQSFLEYLPTLCESRHDNVVEFVLWKAIELSTQIGPDDVPWDDLVSVFKGYDWDSGKLSKILCNDSWKAKFIKESSSIHRHDGCVCNRVCYPPETVYYCFTCTINPVYEICEHCFDKAAHDGHLFTARTVTRAEGKICHCGDPAVFNEPILAYNCKQESSEEPKYEVDLSGRDLHLLTTLNTLFDYLIEYSLHFKESKLENIPLREHSIMTNTYDEKNRFKGTSFDAKLSSNPTPLTQSPSSISNNTNHTYEKWAITINNEDCTMHYMDLASHISRILKQPTEYAIGIVDSLLEESSFAIIVESTNLDKIKRIAQEFESNNVKVSVCNLREIFKQLLIEDIINWILNKCLNDKDSLRFKHILRLSLLDIWNSELPLKPTKKQTSTLNPYISKINLLGGFLVSNEQDSLKPWFNTWDLPSLKNEYMRTILSNYNQRIQEANSPDTIAHFYTLYGSRLQYILTESMMLLCSQSKRELLKIVNSIFSISDESRCFVAAQYLDVYLTLLYKTVSSDPTGYRLCMMSLLSQNIFLEPNFALLAIQCGFIERTLKFAFTLMYFEADDLMPYLSIALHSGFKLPYETIKSRRTIICFKDLCSIMSTNRSPALLLERLETFEAVVSAFASFSSILPLKRETSEHVEFENFDFSAFYFFFSSCLIMLDGYVRNLSMIIDKEKRIELAEKLLNIVINKEFASLLKSRNSYGIEKLNPNMAENTKSLSPQKIPLVKFKICNHVTDIVNFQVGIDTQYLFNPMSYMFKFIVQWARCGRYEELPYNTKELIDFDKIFEDKQKALYISESSLSTLVLIGQVHVGFWVRNGSPIIHQIRMYTKYSMREFTYFSDIFNVQFSMAMSNPNDFMVNYLAKWGLQHWANGVPTCDYPDVDTTLSIVDESLILLIQLLTDMRGISIRSSIDSFEKTLKTEIIHAVSFQSCTYSQIMSTIPEHITKHNAFDIALRKYTKYTAPSGLNDSGLFSLKDEYKEEIDPYYIGLPNGKRYELEQLLRKHISKKNNIEYENSFVPAKKVIDQVKTSTFSNLYGITSVDTFGLFLKNSLDHIKKFGHESLLNRVLHLIHVCVVNNINEFSKIFWREYAIVDTEYCNDHSIGAILYSCLLMDRFTDTHGKIKEIFRIFNSEVAHVNVKEYLMEQTTNFKPDVLLSSLELKSVRDEEFERKKQIAKLRKEKLMRKLARQQKKFIELNCPPQCNNSEQTTATTSAEDLLTLDMNDDTIDSSTETCVFCKMKKDDDQYVYFAYQERNICDEGLLSKLEDILQQGKEVTVTDSISRACGHGSHIRCLGHHMKTARAVHNQTTKNIPIAYGLGVIYCPVCASLCNSILPHLNGMSENKDIDMLMDDGLDLEITEKQDVANAFKCALILYDLYMDGSNNSEPGLNELYQVILKILINTVANFEIRSRDKINVKNVLNVLGTLPCQTHLTCKLLNDLRLFLKEYARRTGASLDNNVNTSIFDLLDGTGFSDVEPIISLKLEHDVITLATHCPHIGDSPERYLSTSDDTINNLGESDTNGHEESLKEFLNRLPDAGSRFRDKIIESLTVFLRRLFTLTQVVSSPHSPTAEVLGECDEDNEIAVYWNYFKIKRSLEEYLCRVVRNECRLMITMMSINDINVLSSVLPVQLVNLPDNLSDFQLQGDSFPDNSANSVATPNADNRGSTSVYHGGNTAGDISDNYSHDIAVCLMCSKQLHMQRLVSHLGFEIGQCTHHARSECPMTNPYGLFLLVRSNAVYITYGQRGVFYPGPYLNQFGERDQEFRYGTPVYLDRTRYDYIKNDILLGNMIPHIVFRLTDGNADLGGWETM